MTDGEKHLYEKSEIAPNNTAQLRRIAEIQKTKHGLLYVDQAIEWRSTGISWIAWHNGQDILHTSKFPNEIEIMQARNKIGDENALPATKKARKGKNKKQPGAGREMD